MSATDVVTLSDEGREWLLNTRAVRVHNAHLSSGQSASAGCAVCGEGLEGAMAPIAGPRQEPQVDEGDGGDTKDDPTLPPGGWAG